jgi:hypothetical protein
VREGEAVKSSRGDFVNLESDDIAAIGREFKNALAEVERLLQQAVNTEPNERDQLAVALTQSLMQERMAWEGQHDGAAWLEARPRPKWNDPSGTRDRDEVMAERAYALADAMLKARAK